MAEKGVSVLTRGMSSVEVSADPEFSNDGQFPEVRCSAPGGFGGCAHLLEERVEGAREALDLASSMTSSEDGAFVALLGIEGPNRPLVLVQANHDGSGGSTFYSRLNNDPDSIWRDFYFRTIFTALERADEVWGSPEIALLHPNNGGGWNFDLFAVALEAIGLLADNRQLSVERVHLTCLHSPPREVEQFVAAAERLNSEQTGPEPPRLVGFDVEEVNAKLAGRPIPSDSLLLRIPMVDQHR